MVNKMFWLVGIAFCLTACFMFAEQTSINSRLNPSVDYSLYKTFYLHQAAKLSQEQATPNLLPKEKYLLKQIKHRLNSRGYQPVLNPEEADFWVVVNYSNIYNLNHQPLKDNLAFQHVSRTFYEEITRIGGNNYSLPYVELLSYSPNNGEYIWYAFGYSDGMSVDLTDWGTRVINKMLSKYPFSEDYGGIGITVDRNLRILKIFEGSPAQHQGLQPDDIITRINGININGYKQCINMLKGKSYTALSITITRSSLSPDTKLANKEFTYQLERWPLNSFYTWRPQRANKEKSTTATP